MLVTVTQRTEQLDNSVVGASVLSVWVGGDNTVSTGNTGFSGCVKVG